jgi:3-oxoacyl-[acyl-carrier-protein] synthase-3
MGIKIIGTGSYIPELVRTNDDFLGHEFYQTDGTQLTDTNDTILRKFKAITGIQERRYAADDVRTSDMGAYASKKAIADADINPETIDYIIVAHNYGDVTDGISDMLPSLGTRIKSALGIANPKCVAYDVLFGCPGWVLGLTQANAFITSGIAKTVLIVGTEALSRVVDPHDRDSMIYADGAGAAIIQSSEDNAGILGQVTATYAQAEAYFISNKESYKESIVDHKKYIKMYGRRIYNFALTHVPQGMKEALDQSGIAIDNLDKIFIHQANEKMDEAIVQRFYQLYDKEMPEHIMPMNIHKLGNSSVATVPTVLDMVLKGELEGHELNRGDKIMFASVGAGMNINAVVLEY